MIRALKLSLLAGALCLAGCAWSIGGRSETVQPTVGRQLMDLQTAHERGAITEQEYERKKKQLLGEPLPPKSDDAD